jgi:glycine/D-amino acid oxidase-like deaminating enzyme
MFQRLRIDPELLARAGVERVTDQEARQKFGLNGAGNNAGIVFPYVDAAGIRRTCRLRRDHQLWAEAYHRYRQGEVWWLDTPELNLLASEEQEERYEPGVWDNIILKWAEDPVSGRICTTGWRPP